jgi:hypothetical protein
LLATGVIVPSLGWVGQELLSLCDLHCLLVCSGTCVLWVHVGVKLPHPTAIGAVDRRLVGVRRHSEYGVEVIGGKEHRLRLRF